MLPNKYKYRMFLDRYSSLVGRFKSKKADENEDSGGAAKYTMLDVLKNRTLCTYALVMCLLWLVIYSFSD